MKTLNEQLKSKLEQEMISRGIHQQRYGQMVENQFHTVQNIIKNTYSIDYQKLCEWILELEERIKELEDKNGR